MVTLTDHNRSRNQQAQHWDGYLNNSIGTSASIRNGYTIAPYNGLYNRDQEALICYITN